MAEAVLPILCVYCGELKPLPPKGEHIVLKGLGGRAVTRLVCGDCNQEFGDELDNKFLRHGPVAYYRFLDPTVTRGQIGDVQFVPSPRGGYLDTIFHNTQETEVKTQVHIIGEDFLIFRPDKDADEVDRILESLKGVDATIRPEILDEEWHDPPRFIVDMKRKSHLIRARTQDLAEKVRAAIKKGPKPPTSEVEPVDITGQPAMLRMSYDPNLIGRCVAKMAFNLASMVFGSEAMVHHRFDPVREYIRGNNVIEAQLTTTPDGKVVGKLDERHVARWFNEPRSELIRPTSWHIVELDRYRGELVARVCLVGGLLRFFVRLGPLGDLQGEGLPAAVSREDDGDYWFLYGERKTDAEVQAGVAGQIRGQSPKRT